MIREEDGTCSLHIEATTNDDDGNYTFMAANPQVQIPIYIHMRTLFKLKRLKKDAYILKVIFND